MCSVRITQDNTYLSICKLPATSFPSCLLARTPICTSKLSQRATVHAPYVLSKDITGYTPVKEAPKDANLHRQPQSLRSMHSRGVGLDAPSCHKRQGGLTVDSQQAP